MSDNQAVVESDPKKLYFNQTDQTYLFLREAPYLETPDADKPDQPLRLTFWSFNSFHRVFGLYVQRTKIDEKKFNKKSDPKQFVAKQINFNLNASQTEFQFSNNLDDWHSYAIYRPERPYLMNGWYSEYSDDRKKPQKLTDDLRPQFYWYQSLTSMLMMGNFMGNPDERLALEQLAAQMPKPLTAHKICDTDNPIESMKYFWLSAGRQLGQHLYIIDNGYISTIRLFVREDPDTGKWLMDMFTSSKIHAQYPTIRNQRNDRYYRQEPKRFVMDSQIFTMGLLYRRFGSDNQCNCYLKIDTDRFGRRDQLLMASKNYWTLETDYQNSRLTDDRIYGRTFSETRPIAVAGVYELTQKLFRRFCLDDRQKKSDERPTTSRYALYVCAGAKLTVRDSYNSYPNIEKHNQVLVEQGGVVVVEDVLELSVPVFVDNLPVMYRWKDFCKKFIKNNESIRKSVENYKNPVVFLGANESDYNTIAWDLVIDKRGDQEIISENPRVMRWGRRCSLRIPEGAYIVAVEEWAPGIDEIWRRHQYEQLHRAIVRHSQDNPYLYETPKPFRVPDKQMLEKILTNTWTKSKTPVDRHIEIDIVECEDKIRKAYENYYKDWNINQSDRYNRKNPKVYPKEFNFYRFIEVNDRSDWRSYCPPPAYPPVKITINPETSEHRLFYLPQLLTFPGKMCDLRTVYKKYSYDPMTYKTLSKKSIYPFENQESPILVLREESGVFDEYEWNPIDNPCDYKHLMENRLDYRLGVDGRYYLKTNHRIGKVQSLYYEFVDPSDVNKTAIQVNIDPKVNDITVGQQPLFIKRTDNQITTLIKGTELKPEPYITKRSDIEKTSSQSMASTSKQSLKMGSRSAPTPSSHSHQSDYERNSSRSHHPSDDDYRRKSGESGKDYYRRSSRDDDYRQSGPSRGSLGHSSNTDSRWAPTSTASTSRHSYSAPRHSSHTTQTRTQHSRHSESDDKKRKFRESNDNDDDDDDDDDEYDRHRRQSRSRRSSDRQRRRDSSKDDEKNKKHRRDH